MKKVFLMTWIICVLLVLSACAVMENDAAKTEAAGKPEKTTQPSAEPARQPEPLPSPSPEATPVLVRGVIKVRGGDTLERDIIPQLCDVFSLSEAQVKEALEDAQSPLISEGVSGFRRMEGIIVPGQYEVTEETLDDYINIWISRAEQRYDGLLSACGNVNDLKEYERLTLASIVDWECLSDEFQAEAAAVLLNRLEKGDKLQCCATVEYALGYSRPYLTSDDIKVQSEYNTYAHKGMPPGPICTVDDESLSAAIGKPVDDSLYFFFYDYAPATMQVFTDYGTFKEKAIISKQLFVETFDIGKYDKVDKRSYFFAEH